MLLVMERQSLPVDSFALRRFRRNSWPVGSNRWLLNSNFCMASEKATKHTDFCLGAGKSKARRPVKELEVVEN